MSCHSLHDMSLHVMPWHVKLVIHACRVVQYHVVLCHVGEYYAKLRLVIPYHFMSFCVCMCAHVHPHVVFLRRSMLYAQMAAAHLILHVCVCRCDGVDALIDACVSAFFLLALEARTRSWSEVPLRVQTSAAEKAGISQLMQARRANREAAAAGQGAKDLARSRVRACTSYRGLRVGQEVLCIVCMHTHLHADVICMALHLCRCDCTA